MIKCELCDNEAVFFEDFRGRLFEPQCGLHRDQLLKVYAREEFTYKEISKEEWIIRKVMDA